jgi:hypothetical protein
MNDFRYALIRFVPDLERMEPFNVGIILQGQGRLDFKLSPHAAKRKDVDTTIFQKWRAFFEEEIRGDAVPFLQPPRDSREFLNYLAGLCDQTVTISQPLYLAERPEGAFDGVMQSLYERLVAPPDQPKREQDPRPTSTFRELEETKQFRKRGMKKHPYIALPGMNRWNAYRQVLNGENIVIDKVEIGHLVGLTADEIQKLSSGVSQFLDHFLDANCSSMPRRYVLIADQLEQKFTDQSDDDFHAMTEELQKVVEEVKRRGGGVLRDPNQVSSFADEVDRKLPILEELQKASAPSMFD